MLTFLHIVSLLIATPSVGAPNQGLMATPADSQAVLVAVIATGAKEMFSPKAIRVITTRMGRGAGAWPTATITGLASSIDARVSRYEDAVKCTGSALADCVLVGGAQVMTIRSPVFAGDTAFVVVGVLSSTGSVHRPIGSVAREYIVVRRGGRWVVSGTRLESIS